MLDIKNNLSEYSEINPEPKKPMDTRSHNENGVLEFYDSNKVSTNAVLDIANYYFKSIGRPQDTIDPKEYHSDEPMVKAKRHNLLKVCSENGYSNVFNKDSDLLGVLEFISMRCKENYDIGNYDYLNEVVQKVVPTMIEGSYAAMRECGIKKEFNKIYEYSLFMNTISRNKSYPLYDAKYILNKQWFNSDEEIIDFIKKDLEQIKKEITLSLYRDIALNKRDEKYFKIKMKHSIDSYVLHIMVSTIRHFSNEIKSEEFFLEKIIDILGEDLREVSSVDKLKIQGSYVNYVNVGYEKNSLLINSIHKVLQEGSGFKKLKNRKLIVKEISSVDLSLSGLESSVDSKDIFVDLLSINNIPSFVFKVREDLISNENNIFVKKAKNLLLDKLQEVFERGSFGNFEEEDKKFVQECVHMLELGNKLHNKEGVVRQKVKL